MIFVFNNKTTNSMVVTVRNIKKPSYLDSVH